MILAGYEHNNDEVVQNLLSCLDNPELPFLQWPECFAVLANRLPKELRNEAHLSSCSEKEKVAQERLVEPLMSLVKSYERGREGHARIIVQGLFEDYLSVEEFFNDNIQADVIELLRLQYKKDLLKVVDIVLSHQVRFSSLNHTNYSELALNASQLLEQTKLSELRTSITRSLSELEMFTEEGENMDTPKRKSAINERMEALVNASLAVEDALVGLFDHSDHTLQ